jgi:hypothetical protein
MSFFDNFSPTELGSVRLIPPNLTTGAKGDYVKMLELHADDRQAREVMISLRAEYSLSGSLISPGQGEVNPPAQGVPQTGGPLVCRITFGVGGGYNVIEFDVSPSRVPANFAPIAPLPGKPENQPVSDIGDGTVVVLSGSSFTVELRNDANLSSLTNPGANSTNTSLVPVKALAFAAPGSFLGRPLKRAVLVAGGTPNAPLTAGTTVVVTIPSFAHRVTFPRSPSNQTPLFITTTDAFGQIIRTIDVGVNDEGNIELSPRELILTIRNDGAVSASVLQAYFDVDPS